MKNFSPESRVWIYLSSRQFSSAEVVEINSRLQQFCLQWTAHGSNLHAHGEVLHQRFILLMVDETRAGASGCSIDKSIHFIQELEKKFEVQLFNRLLVAIKDGVNVEVLHSNEVKQLIENGKLSEDTLVFDTLIQTRKEFDERFLIPLKKSWLSRFLPSVVY